MKTVRVYVTQKDIKEGVQESPVSCPIALSLRREGCTKVDVGTNDVSFILKEERGRITYELPLRAKRFIKKFDQKGKGSVKPISFSLTPLLEG